MFKRLFCVFTLLFFNEAMASNINSCSATATVKSIAQKSFMKHVYTLNVEIDAKQAQCFGGTQLVFDIGQVDTKVEWIDTPYLKGFERHTLNIRTNNSLWVQPGIVRMRELLAFGEGSKIHLDLQHTDGFCIERVFGKENISGSCFEDILTLSMLETPTHNH